MPSAQFDAHVHVCLLWASRHPPQLSLAHHGPRPSITYNQSQPQSANLIFAHLQPAALSLRPLGAGERQAASELAAGRRCMIQPRRGSTPGHRKAAAWIPAAGAFACVACFDFLCVLVLACFKFI
jgi:hypothetical protein